MPVAYCNDTNGSIPPENFLFTGNAKDVHRENVLKNYEFT